MSVNADRSIRPRGNRRAPLALAATVTTLWAAVVSFVPTMVIVAFAYTIDATGGVGTRLLRLGLAGWLLAHGVPLHTGLGPIGLAPLAVSVFAAWRVTRAGVHTARAIGARKAPAQRVPAAAGAVAVVYALLGGLAAWAAGLPGVDVSIPRAMLTFAVFGGLTGALGAAIAAGVPGILFRRLPPVVGEGIRTGMVGALLLFGAGAGAAGMAIAVNGGEASQILNDYRTGILGQFGLILVCVLYGPTMAVWAASYLIGPGFSIGVGTTISAGQVTIGRLPALPALAGLPGKPAGALGALMLGLPLAAGMTAGWLHVRRARRRATGRQRTDPVVRRKAWLDLVCSCLVAGPVAASIIAVASYAATGSLGRGQLAEIGPHTVPVSLLGGLIVAVGALVAAVATRLVADARRSADTRP